MSYLPVPVSGSWLQAAHWRNNYGFKLHKVSPSPLRRLKPSTMTINIFVDEWSTHTWFSEWNTCYRKVRHVHLEPGKWTLQFKEFIKLSGSTFETSKRLKCLLFFLLITQYDIHQEYQQVLQYQEDNAFNNLTDLLFTCLKNSKVQLLNIYLFAERFIPFSLNRENICRKLDFSPRQIREAECVWWTPTCLSVFNELKDLYRNGFVIIINKGVFSNTLLYRNLYLPIICVN